MDQWVWRRWKSIEKVIGTFWTQNRMKVVIGKYLGAILSVIVLNMLLKHKPIHIYTCDKEWLQIPKYDSLFLMKDWNNYQMVMRDFSCEIGHDLVVPRGDLEKKRTENN